MLCGCAVSFVCFAFIRETMCAHTYTCTELAWVPPKPSNHSAGVGVLLDWDLWTQKSLSEPFAPRSLLHTWGTWYMLHAASESCSQEMYCPTAAQPELPAAAPVPRQLSPPPHPSRHTVAGYCIWAVTNKNAINMLSSGARAGSPEQQRGLREHPICVRN